MSAVPGERPAPPAWLAAAAVLAVALAFLLILFDVSFWHPGYAYGDERLVVCHLQDLREGAPFLWRFGRGCLSLGLQWAWVSLAGPSLLLLHVPQLALTLLAWVCLAVLARRWLGEEAACWSVLALVLCCQTWVRSRGLLAFQALPAEALLAALLALLVRGRTTALLWGLAASLLFLDYDGAFIAVPGVFLACLGFEPGFRRRWLPALFGLALGGVCLALRQHEDLARYASVRMGLGGAWAGAPDWAARLRFLRQLALGGPNLPYFGVTDWPAWAPWTWIGLALGLWVALRSGAWGLGLWAVGGVLLTQGVSSAYGLPIHRLAAVAPALALLSGAGFTLLRRGLGRFAWLLLVPLLLAGAASEGWAWCRHQWAFGPELYDRCESLERVRTAYAADLADPSTRVLVQFDGMFQADARFALGLAPWPKGKRAGRVLALVPASYAPALAGLGSGVKVEWLWVEKGLDPAVVVRAEGAAARRLEAISAALVPLVGRDTEEPAARLAGCEDWLAAPTARDPWTRTAVLEADVQDALLAGGAGQDRVGRLDRARLVSDAPWMVLARSLCRTRPRAALGWCSRALALEPRDGEALLTAAACLRALGRGAEAGRVSAEWVALRAEGRSWRHTL